MKTLTLALLSVMAGSSLAQQPAQTSSSNGAAVNSALSPSDQAPDDVLARLSGLIRAGKYTEAQQTASMLLTLYPADQRLTKAKLLLDKMLASSTPANATNGPAISSMDVQPTAGAPADQLTGMDKVQYNSLLELGREAQQTADLDQQKKSLQQFMNESIPFLQKHPGEMLLWQMRAVSAISLDDPLAGYEAGQKLLASGAADSNDSNLQHLLAQLNLRGWLDKQRATVAAAQKVRPAQSEAERMLTEATRTADGANSTDKWSMSGFTAETFVLTINGNSQSFRYDQVHSFKVFHYPSWGWTYVAIKGDFPSNFFWKGANYPYSWTGIWAPDLFVVTWDKSHKSDAQSFATALSTLAKSGAPAK